MPLPPSDFNSARARLPFQLPLVGESGHAAPQVVKFLDSLSDVIASGPVLYDTHANRINTLQNTLPYYPPGKFLRYLFFETDRELVYQCQMVSGVPAWVYVAGVGGVTGPGSLPSDLGTNDIGVLYRETQYRHLYYWSGAAWVFAPGDAGAGYIVPSLTGGAPFNSGSAWQVCDGSTVAVSKGDGTTTNITTPNLTTGVTFIAAAGSQSGPNAASAPTYVSNPVTSGVDSASTTVQSGSGATVAAHTHTHSVTQSAINPPTVANGGLPANMQLVWYMRR